MPSPRLYFTAISTLSQLEVMLPARFNHSFKVAGFIDLDYHKAFIIFKLQHVDTAGILPDMPKAVTV